MSRGNLQGIPTLEITIGDYLEPWEKQEIRERILKRIEESKFSTQKVIQGKRNTDMTIVVTERKKDI